MLLNLAKMFGGIKVIAYGIKMIIDINILNVFRLYMSKNNIPVNIIAIQAPLDQVKTVHTTMRIQDITLSSLLFPFSRVIALCNANGKTATR